MNTGFRNSVWPLSQRWVLRCFLTAGALAAPVAVDGLTNLLVFNQARVFDSPSVFSLGCAAAQEAAGAGQFLEEKIPAQFDLWTLDQKKDRQKYGERRTARSEFEKKVTDALSAANTMSGADQKNVFDWLDKVILAEMTINNQDVLTKLGDLRVDLFRRYITPTSNPENRKFLLDRVVRPKVLTIANGNYHPAARVNAVQILGLLDAEEGVSGDRPPRVDMVSLGQLVNLMRNPETPDYLVATALSGLQRTAKIDGQLPSSNRMAAAARNAIIDEMLKVITKYEGRQTESDPGYVLSRRAIQTIGSLNIGPSDPKTAAVKSAMQKIATDVQIGRWLRMDAMLVLANLPIDDPSAYVTELGKLVTLVAKQERQSMVTAQKLVEVEKDVNSRIGSAEASAATSNNNDRKRAFGGGGGESEGGQGLGGGENGFGGGGATGGGQNFGMFAQGDLMPFHLHHLRANVKLASGAARQILGTEPKASKGLKMLPALKDDAQAMALLTRVDEQLVELQKITDIGLVEEKEITEFERLRMDPERAAMLDEPNVVRVLSGIGFAIKDLEKLVGEVKMVGELSEEEMSKAVAAVSDADAAKEDAQMAASGDAESVDAESPDAGSDETGAEGEKAVASANDTPASDTPASDPPASDPPASDPPASDPPASDPPAGDNPSNG